MMLMFLLGFLSCTGVAVIIKAIMDNRNSEFSLKYFTYVFKKDLYYKTVGYCYQINKILRNMGEDISDSLPFDQSITRYLRSYLWIMKNGSPEVLADLLESEKEFREFCKQVPNK